MNGDTLIAIFGIVALMSFGLWSALKPGITARRIVGASSRQPLPDVTSEDVERIVRRDFRDARFEDVMSILTECTSQWESDIPRIQLAALKLANGNLESLRRHVNVAKQDFRDVLVVAEYPQYWKATSRVRDLSKHARQQLYDADWKQYESWLRKS